jgi:hypothetical protein
MRKYQNYSLMSELRGCEIGSDHYLIQAKLRIPPKWQKTPANIQN